MPKQTRNAMTELKALGGAAYFEQIHHFASDKFKTPASPFQTHWDYCGAKDSFRGGGNNDQTCRRIKAVIENRKAGATWERAIARAWQQFPALSK